ncbi:MAG: GNAT family N-acetyltransferase, partial [Gammaproteobacteria bacterium]|nr:GNAT family N-acetyltransferase [Gammaproteobacteria bacterium]
MIPGAGGLSPPTGYALSSWRSGLNHCCATPSYVAVHKKRLECPVPVAKIGRKARPGRCVENPESLAMSIRIECARRRASPRGEAVRLKDGTFCRIRPIDGDDPAIVTACFEGLSDASRRLRFFGAKRVLTEADLAYLTGADGRDHLAFAALRRSGSGGDTEVLGVARCIRSTSGSEPVSETAELAMAVVDRAQGNGVGAALLEHLIAEAREQGIRRFRCEVLAD